MSDVGYLHAAAQAHAKRDEHAREFWKQQQQRSCLYIYIYIIVFNRDDDSTDIHIYIYILYSRHPETNKRAASSLNMYIAIVIYTNKKKKNYV